MVHSAVTFSLQLLFIYLFLRIARASSCGSVSGMVPAGMHRNELHKPFSQNFKKRLISNVIIRITSACLCV
jgi:hypothetical protein